MKLEIFYVTAGISNTQQFLDMGIDHLMMSAYAITKQGVGSPRQLGLLKGTTWILDSGMISAWRKHDVGWADRQDHIAALARKHCPTYVSHLDMPVERHFLQMNHISKTDALALSYRNARSFLDMDVGAAKKIFVLQGWDIDDYSKCFQDFQNCGIIDACHAEGHSLGVGTMCLRKPTQGIFQICEAIRDWTRGIRVHVFGIGQASYQKCLDQMGIDSTDTASFMLNNMVWKKARGLQMRSAMHKVEPYWATAVVAGASSTGMRLRARMQNVGLTCGDHVGGLAAVQNLRTAMRQLPVVRQRAINMHAVGPRGEGNGPVRTSSVSTGGKVI